MPFVGAGVSGEARNPSCSEFRPAVWWLQQRLAARLGQEVERILRAADVRFALLDILGALNIGHDKAGLPADPAADLCPLAPEIVRNIARTCEDGRLVAFDRLCEVLRWYIGYRQLVDVLQISRFEGLSTLPVHRYMARLAREGLISEIITTNYDSCLEEAWRHTFLDVERPSEPRFAPALIRTLREYRERAAERQDNKGRPVLHIYKINGCATRLHEEMDLATTTERREQLAKEIILTERQLQDFRGERWKQDLLQDRARGRSLVLTGFGNDEPQVRHTVLNLVAEFARDGQGERRAANEAAIWMEKNAPFVAAFDEQLSYPQMQLLLAFREAHGPTSDRPADRLNLDEINAFTGRDARELDAAAGQDRLPADLLWARVFQVAMRRLVERHSRRGTAYFRWLEDAGLAPEALRQDLLRWLHPSGTTTPAWGDRSWLWDELAPHADGTVMLRICWWLLCIRGDLTPARRYRWQNDYYLPIREDSLFILATLTLLSRLCPDLTPGEVAPDLLGLRVATPAGSVFLVVERRDMPVGMGGSGVPGALIRQIALPSLHRGPDRELRYMDTTEPTGTRSRRIARVARASAADMLAELARADVGPLVALRRVFASTALPGARARLTPLEPGGRP